MIRFPWRRQPTREPIGQIINIGDQRLGIVDLGTELSGQLRSQISRNILTRGEPFCSGGILGSACLPVIGTGSAAASSLFAGNIFLATANPASLMAIGGGVGSQVMGAGGIVAQAPFIAASSAIVPVVAPVMFFMVVSAMMISARFDQIQASLDQLREAVEQLLRREIAHDYGMLISTIERLQDISGEFAESRRFTQEMKIRLALVEADVNVLRNKYGVLLETPVDSVDDAELSPIDINLFAYSSLADIQVDGLRLKLALQDNPDNVMRSLAKLNTKIAGYVRSFRDLLNNDKVKEYEDKLRVSVEEMDWFDRNISAGKEHDKKGQLIEKIRTIRDDSLEPIRLSVARWSERLDSMKDSGLEQSVLYYREDNGGGELKAYYTSDWQLQDRSGTNDVAQ